MESDSSKQGYNNYGNTFPDQYPPVATGNVYLPNNPPPPYAQYPQQVPGYQTVGTPYQGPTPLYQQQGTVVVPVYQRVWNNLFATPMTPNLRLFLIISGILYLIWGILDIGLEVGIIMNSYTTYYRGLWSGGLLIGAGICMLVASCRTSYVMSYLIRLYGVVLFFVILGLILSIINLATSIRCDSYYYYLCDDQRATNLKIVILILFIISTIHTVVNINVASTAQKRAILASVSNAPGYQT